MYALATIQPHLPRANGPPDSTAFLTRDEKRAWADRVSARTDDTLPVCLEHAGGERPTAGTDGRFVVPPPLRIGRVVDVLVRGNGDLIGTHELFYDTPEAHAIIDDIDAGRQWGVSLCTNVEVFPDSGRVGAKEPTHVGITQTPEFGPENSWIHYASKTWERIDDEVLRLKQREPDLYVPPATLARLHHRQTRRQQQQQQRTLPPPAPGAQRIDVGASASLGSSAAPRLSEPSGYLPPARPHSAAPAPPAFTFSDSASTRRSVFSSTMAETATPTTTTTAANTNAAPAPFALPTSSTSGGGGMARLQSSGLLDAFHKEVGARFGNLEELARNDPSSVFTLDRVHAARELQSKLSGHLRDAGILENVADWPVETQMDMFLLSQYRNNAQKHMDAHVDATLGMTDQQRAADAKAMLRMHDHPDVLPVAMQVMASANQGLKNQRLFEEMLAAKQAELATKHTADLKRTRDEWETEKRALESRIEEMNKRARVETAAPAAVAAPVVPLKVDLAASNRTRPVLPVLPGLSVGTTTAWLDSYKPAPGLRQTHDFAQLLRLIPPMSASFGSTSGAQS